MATGESQDPRTNSWQAGIARVDITPPLGVWLSGFGNRTKGAQGLHDPLHASALVLANGHSKVAIVSCDLLALDAPDVQAVRTLVANSIGLPPGNVLVHTTHTHSGPLTTNMHGFGTRDDAYDSVLLRKIASAIILADQRLRPARLTLGVAEAPIGINRRESSDGRVIIGENPAGPFDPRAVVLGVWPAKGEKDTPQAIVLWAAVHPVAFGSGNYLLGRDFPGYALDGLENAFPGATGLYLSGPCGDVNPRGRRTPDVFAKARELGSTLVRAATAALASGRDIPPNRLIAAQYHVDVPLQPLPPASDIERERNEMKRRLPAERLGIDGGLRWAGTALAVLRGEPGAPTPASSFKAELQVLLLGDVAFTAMPFEVFSQYQSVAVRTAPVPDTFVLGYSNGNYGYLPTAEAFAEGGYEVDRAYRYYGLQALSSLAPAAVEKGIAALHRRAEKLMKGHDGCSKKTI